MITDEAGDRRSAIVGGSIAVERSPPPEVLTMSMLVVDSLLLLIIFNGLEQHLVAFYSRGFCACLCSFTLTYWKRAAVCPTRGVQCMTNAKGIESAQDKSTFVPLARTIIGLDYRRQQIQHDWTIIMYCTPLLRLWLITK